MPQGALPFQYAEENTSTGMTALSGLPAYVDMAEVSGLVESVRTHMNGGSVRSYGNRDAGMRGEAYPSR